MSDSRVLIEASRAHLVLTNDKELVGCGELINKVEALPKIEWWPIE